MRVATFNILHGRSPEDDRVDLDRFAAAVKDLDADVLGLQEVDRDQPRSFGADLTAVAAEAMGAPEHQFVAALRGTPGATWMAATGDEQPGSATYGIALLSRLPVHSWETVRLPAPPTRMPVKFPDRRWPVLAHDEPRVAVAAVVEGPRGLITVVNTHLSFVPRWNSWQLRRLMRAVSGCCPEPLLLTGDLNMDSGEPERVTGLRSLAQVPTFPAHAPHRQLDHVLARGDVGEVAAAEAPCVPLSDHRPLVVDLR
ncbi:endonuclease/exonuclease/phosphatase family metal-dependent hydrolase [Kineococcus xinjiangensis]|uniref:Endonuclease/exonuclease/phosphatase family metal-dependent hydrolase n=1 Tax=Kineococcus xinjiangensis TaxID=512762 RepID=A0A2S6IE19_9ACTN|nr:endonuclease/exonuclease/phosphatase family protein [Kineococcus xinjiangensis]PPK92436.1 endonuclease/exonuclease/phosphatase family metal-dependent hydrolase [Kineococcus xinjiangensis]